MPEEIASIDVSPIESLLQIKTKQDELQQLVARAEASRASVSEAVYRRVTGDYAARGQALEAEAKPLRKKARQEHARLSPIHDRLRRQVEEAKLDKEELEFRHSVGELTDEEFTPRSGAAEELLLAREKAFAEADELAQRFVAVMGSAEADGEPAPAVAAQVAPDLDTTEETACIPSVERGEIEGAELQPITEGTMVMRYARLAAETGEEYQLGQRTTIGRTPDNDITIANGLVSRHHAVVTHGDAGWVVSDLKSGNGTFVNDQRIEQQALADNDRVKIGHTVFVFHVVGD